MSSTHANNLYEISTNQKLRALCSAMQLSPLDLDNIISNNSAVLRTVKGHSFEYVFDQIMTQNGINSQEVGGDSGVDRIVNGHSLQLKTPTASGTNKTYVQYKTHKTHGPKSESESLDYYYRKDLFADYLVGLYSYRPFQIMVIPKEELPSHISSENHIKSPFSLPIKDSPYLNNISVLGLDNLDVYSEGIAPSSDEMLPKTSKKLNLSTSVIVNTILNPANFRIWDMNLRGFIREYKLFQMIKKNGITIYETSQVRTNRPEKSDFSLQNQIDQFEHFQVKGATFSGCKFIGQNSRVDIESQLSRGRINDHPTQSRLYLETDFDELVLCLDPVYSTRFQHEVNIPRNFDWEFFSIPTQVLARHAKMPHRINSHQYIEYLDLLKYKIDNNWLLKYK